MIINKESKTIGLLGKLHKALRRSHLLAIYKAFERPHLDCGSIVYDHDNNLSFCQKLGLIQYDAYLAITRAIGGTS